MRPTALVTLLSCLLGCTDGVGPIAGSLQVEIFPPVVRLSNRSSAPIYSFVVERQALAYVDWIPCTNPLTCQGLAPGQDSLIQYTAITGYAPGAEEAVVYWWHLIPKEGGGLKPDSVRGVVIDL